MNRNAMLLELISELNDFVQLTSNLLSRLHEMLMSDLYHQPVEAPLLPRGYDDYKPENFVSSIVRHETAGDDPWDDSVPSSGASQLPEPRERVVHVHRGDQRAPSVLSWLTMEPQHQCLYLCLDGDVEWLGERLAEK